MEGVVYKDYIFIYFHTETAPENLFDSSFFKQLYEIVDNRCCGGYSWCQRDGIAWFFCGHYRYKENLRALYVIHPSWWFKVAIINRSSSSSLYCYITLFSPSSIALWLVVSDIHSWWNQGESALSDWSAVSLRHHQPWSDRHTSVCDRPRQSSEFGASPNVLLYEDVWWF